MQNNPVIPIENKRRTAHQLGLVAEQLAADYLQTQGFALLGQRVRTLGGEIDVLALHGNTLVIVEVKARKHAEEGLWSVTPAKQKRLARAAEAVLMEYPRYVADIRRPPKLQNLSVRFDVVIISPNAKPLHIENAWYVE